ncbi:FtsZ-binding cell division protein ZapB [Virgibacillus natechei]|uniref:FtsZ-binding cell division protein ZapB n=1 Tax=Virgibacillus natechei TaxID=1216297 RepID=A0ABS4IL24_9BACI|nr:FtsZ-binding cell division protein ZapB [Virgibacillus natechei]
MNAKQRLQEALNTQKTIATKKLKTLLRDSYIKEIKELRKENNRLSQSRHDYKQKWERVRKKNRNLKDKLEGE